MVYNACLSFQVFLVYCTDHRLQLRVGVLMAPTGRRCCTGIRRHVVHLAGRSVVPVYNGLPIACVRFTVCRLPAHVSYGLPTACVYNGLSTVCTIHGLPTASMHGSRFADCLHRVPTVRRVDCHNCLPDLPDRPACRGSAYHQRLFT